MISSLQARDGRYWHGPYKDTGTTWGAAVDAWLFPDEMAARRALRGLSCPSAADAGVVIAPAAALVGGEPAEATDGELEVASENLVRPSRRVRIKRRGSAR